MTSMKNVQFSRPFTLLVHLHPKFFHPFELGRLVSNDPPPLQIPPCMWTNKIKTKKKSRHVTFKLTMLSIFRFSPTSNTMVSLINDFTVWRQKEDFLLIMLIFGSVWCLVMAQTQFSLIKKKDWTSRTLAISSPPTSDNTSFLP